MKLEDAWVVRYKREGVWWRANGAGYSADLLGAGLYTEAEAKRIARTSFPRVGDTGEQGSSEEAYPLLPELLWDKGTVGALLMEMRADAERWRKIRPALRVQDVYTTDRDVAEQYVTVNPVKLRAITAAGGQSNTVESLMDQLSLFPAG